MSNSFLNNDLDFSVSYHNFDPEDIQTDETVNCVFVVDLSPSVQSYVADLNHAFNDFIAQVRQSHLADQLLVSIVEFNEKVWIETGFQPASHVPAINFVPCGGGTALYDATLRGLKHAVDYRQTLAVSGINTKTLLFIITDGEDNSSTIGAAVVREALNKIYADERNTFSFQSILFGVGSAAYFQKAQVDMGIQHLASVGTSGSEIKRMLGLISRSVSSTANNKAITF